jgi:phage terminase large subunit
MNDTINSLKSLMADYLQEIKEIQDYAPNLQDIYFNGRNWILTFKVGEDEIFTTKIEAVQRLIDESKRMD